MGVKVEVKVGVKMEVKVGVKVEVKVGVKMVTNEPIVRRRQYGEKVRRGKLRKLNFSSDGAE